MVLQDVLNGGAVFSGLRPSSKKQALHLISNRVARLHQLSGPDLLAAILDRESLSSTGVGSGVAIPHARFPGLKKIIGFFFRLEKSIDFDAIDDVPVDLIFLLLAPEEEGSGHLHALAQVSRVLRRAEVRQKIRSAPDEAAIMALLLDEPRHHAA